MKIRQLRNATMLVTLAEHRFVVDPMLAEAGELPSLRVTGTRRPNPLVAMPDGALVSLAEATAAIVTHEHPDHLDGAGLRFLAQRELPVWTNGIDAPNLVRKGLDARVLVDGTFGMRVETVRSRHGRGVLGWLLGPVCGYWLAHPDEPSLYIVGDSILTESVLEAIERLQPDVIVAPAGAANMGLGGDILFSLEEIVRLVSVARGRVVLNHLEALDHCPTTRAELRARMRAEGHAERVSIPDDGEELTFEKNGRDHPTPRSHGEERPGFQKWLAARFVAGTAPQAKD